MEQRAILHLDLDTFFVSVERLINSELEFKPVLIGGTSDRGVVASCSYETRAFGVHSGMSMKMARQLCPEAIVVKGNASNYMKYSDEVTQIIKESFPLYEKTSVDEFYADMTGMDRFFGCLKLAGQVRARIRKETGLPLSFGLSQNKTVSKIATGIAKPNNQLRIDYGMEKAFLAPLSVKRIPMVGEKTFNLLCNLGVRKIRTIQQMDVEIMEKVLGKNGVLLWKKANGMDETPVIPFSERKSISTERTFDRDTIDVARLKDILTAMAENLAFQLRRGNKVTACITVKLRYSDFNTNTLQAHIPYTSADHLLIPKVIELFNRLYSKRLLVRLIGVKYSHLVSGSYQMNMFEDNEEIINLYQAMDKVRNKYGDRAVMRASGMIAYSIGRGNPFNGDAPPLLPNRRR